MVNLASANAESTVSLPNHACFLVTTNDLVGTRTINLPVLILLDMSMLSSRGEMKVFLALGMYCTLQFHLPRNLQRRERRVCVCISRYSKSKIGTIMCLVWLRATWKRLGEPASQPKSASYTATLSTTFDKVLNVLAPLFFFSIRFPSCMSFLFY